MRFSRIQFTPDLMPSDVTGSSIWNQRDGDFEFRPGPIFTNLLLADEINRAPPKTQAALLEAMQEHQATIEGVTHRFEPPFLVIATQNPIEYEGTYPLPGRSSIASFCARRSAIRAARGRSTCWLVASTASRTTWSCAPSSIARRCWRCREPSSACTSPGACANTVSTSWSRRARRRAAPSARARAGASRCSSARCRAALRGRDFVLPDDVKAVAVPALAHRLVLRPELWVQRVSAEDVVREVLDTVPTPRAEDVSPTLRS
jgi:MoxR-like ATPase